MIIALDYDGTYTADPVLWRVVCMAAVERGHAVVCVTGRSVAIDFDHDPPLPNGVAVVLAGTYPCKRMAAEAAGYHVSVWIDDMPEMVGPTKLLSRS